MKNYWQSLEGLKEIQQKELAKQEAKPEFSIEGMSEEEVKGKTSRRDFIKMLGFTIGYATLAASCETPVRKAIPYLNQAEEITPGVANYYASTFFDGHDYGSILVKTREGRPIKIEGNKLSSISKGATHARVQASILNLYDNARLKNPKKNGSDSDWEIIDQDVVAQLEKLAQAQKEIVILSSTIISPSTKHIIEEFISKYPTANWISYDAISMSATRNANELNFGRSFIPSYHLDKASLVVGFNADFLGNYLSPVEFTKQYSAARSLLNSNKSMLRHIQYETNMSITGGCADNRVPIKPSEEGLILLNLYNEIAAYYNEATFSAEKCSVDVKALAEELIENKGKSVLISGTNDLQIQLTVNAINYLLDNFDNTIDTDQVFNLKQGMEADVKSLLKRMNAGDVGALIHFGVNPVYDYPEANQYKDALANVDLKISFAESLDETAAECDYVCPNHNYLESWNDSEPKTGVFSMTQPCINPLFNTRQAQDSFMIWAGIEGDYQSYIEKYWEDNLFHTQSKFGNFKSFWNQSVHDGIYEMDVAKKNLKFTAQSLSAKQSSSDLEFFAYEKTGIGNGKYANNPWLQELPDPITTATWDNYACVSPKFAEENNLEFEDVIRIGDFELPIIVQAGLAYGVIAIAYGYGRKVAGKVADNLGKNIYQLANFNTDYISSADSISFQKIEGKKYPLALTQTHHTMEGRSLVRETTLEKFIKNPASGNEFHVPDEQKNASLYSKPEYTGFHWGMVINLSTCTGCSNCVISCQAENNVAVIGKEQVKNRRIMHWMRIDRYYSEDPENPEVFHQPLMCQHCDNAPCENVCPVAATPHSSEGLNQMAYNRCIGTRYCMNNCPYRVRRFNWFEFANNKDFDYNMNNDVGKLVLNPDVVVRSRGVVEKCSLCVQRIQEKKLDAKKENRQLADGDIKTACQQSCPADAIVFGDLLDPNSEVSKMNENPRNYHLLEHVHTLPSTSYLSKIRNKKS